MDLSEFYEVFYEECYEGLEIMENGLVELDIGAADVEEINTIFRAAHSIKGGSATFDFNEIAGFTHVMETLLDEMRSGDRDVTTASVDLLLESVDCLQEMVNATKAEESIDTERVAKLKSKLEKMLEEPESTPSENETNSENEAVSVSSSENTESKSSSTKMWEIEFHPEPEMLLPGNEPLGIFSALEEMGDTKVICLNQDLPSVKNIDPKLLFLGWKIELSGDVSEDQIREVFAWVEDVSKFTIKELSNTNASEDTGGKESISDNKSKNNEGIEPTDNNSKEENKEKTPAPEQKKTVAKSTPTKKKAAKPAKKQAGSEAGSIRVSVDKIDALINLVGELVITQSMLGRFGENIDLSDIEDLRDGLGQLERNSRELQETAMQIRMLPISSSFNRFPRLIRDLSGKLDKKVELKITGENTELDKTVLEKIGDPLVHLVRNSLDHGLETPEVRRANGKPETGIIELNAYHEGGNIVIEVVDDGAGLNKERILSKAIEKNVVAKDENLSDQEIYNLIFQPGFSTAEVVSDVSGRGVGMDVVRRNINDLGGHVYIDSKPGRGSILTIRLPLTLAIIDGQLVRVGKQMYVIPIMSISESLQLDPALVSRYKGKADLYKLREEYIPILKLHDVFDNIDHQPGYDQGLMVVVEVERRRVGLFVDELLGQQQVVIKSLENNFRKAEGFSGATILGDGTVSLILDAVGLIRNYLEKSDKPVSTDRAAA
jgi:two-component system chemotaxis sensor kinase CheA